MVRDDFCIFILSHGRADNVITWGTLDKNGYTGKRYIVIDDEDDQRDEYLKRYGSAVLIFNKREIETTFDTFDNRDERRTVVFARNVCFELAEQLGVTYFLELDDDYTGFEFRYVEKGRLRGFFFRDFDRLCEEMIRFYDASGALAVCTCQGGDFIGGAGNGRFEQGLLRKAMNSFFCSVNRPFKFLGRINEDVNTYTLLGSRGGLFFSVTRIMLTQPSTQSSAGGMTGCYIDGGTYVKSFYTVMCMPSAVKVNVMQSTHKRMHHKVNWVNCVPKILSERFKK